MHPSTATPTTPAAVNVQAAATEALSGEIEPLAAELADIHHQAGHFVAELSEGPTWGETDPFVTRLIADAYVVAMTPGSPSIVDAPAVVRCRELAVAQRALARALRGDGPFCIDTATVVRARALLAELADMCATLRR